MIKAALVMSAVAAGVSGGIAFAFSNFIMRAFGSLAEAESVRAMQAINEAVINPLFLVVFMGTGVATVGLTVIDFFLMGRIDPWLASGAAVYAVGVVAMTVFANVPLNDALARVASDGEYRRAWMSYAESWTTYNHVRTVAAVIAAAAFTIASWR